MISLQIIDFVLLSVINNLSDLEKQRKQLHEEKVNRYKNVKKLQNQIQ